LGTTGSLLTGLTNLADYRKEENMGEREETLIQTISEDGIAAVHPPAVTVLSS